MNQLYRAVLRWSTKLLMCRADSTVKGEKVNAEPGGWSRLSGYEQWWWVVGQPLGGEELSGSCVHRRWRRLSVTSSARGNTDPKPGLVHRSVDEAQAKGEETEVVTVVLTTRFGAWPFLRSSTAAFWSPTGHHTSIPRELVSQPPSARLIVVLLPRDIQLSSANL